MKAWLRNALRADTLRKILRNIVVGAAALAAVPAGAAGFSYFTGPSGSNPINFPAVLGDLNQLIQNIGNVMQLVGANTVAGVRPAGLIYSTTASAAISNATTEQTLGTFSLPTSSLDQPGRKLIIRAGWKYASNGNNKTVKCDFGSSVAMSTGVQTVSGGGGECELIVTKAASSSANAQIAYGRMTVGTSSTATSLVLENDTTVNENESAPITIKITGTDGSASAGDIVLEDFSVQYMN